MEDILVLLATMGGGLGCFLLGMKHLSEGLQSVLRIADEYESLSDEFPVIVRDYRRIRSGDAPWSADSRTAVLGIRLTAFR